MAESSKNMAGNGTEGEKRKKISLSVIIAVAAVIVILILIAVIMYMAMSNKKESKPEVSGGRATIVTQDNVQEVIQSMNEPNTDATYTVTMTNEWTFENGTASAENFYVKNTENNSRTVYFELRLADTDETIYSSPYIPVGEEMRTMTLDKDLDAGDYNVVMTYYLVDENHVELTTVSVQVVIHIQN